jgi:hypothetical protein
MESESRVLMMNDDESREKLEAKINAKLPDARRWRPATAMLQL